ncbi:MAG: hypothetical protein FJ104_07200, partial [Deltaproteobacteria bacterium]|nr:hypothetical protein [Deltaproteobacteria bacterium]
PALLGFDVTLETTAPANVACELTLELIDRNGEGEHVLDRDDDREPYRAPRREFTVGSAP